MPATRSRSRPRVPLGDAKAAIPLLFAAAAAAFAATCGSPGSPSSNDPPPLEAPEAEHQEGPADDPLAVDGDAPGLRKQRGGTNGDGDYCNFTGAPVCTNGEGDCDSNAECAGDGQMCGLDNGGAFGQDQQNDVCVPDTCFDRQQNGTESAVDCGGLCGSCECRPTRPDGHRDRCSYACKCGPNIGDCDSHDACTTGYCGRDNGPLFGLAADVDVCTGSTCQNGRQDGVETGVDCGGDCPPCPPPPTQLGPPYTFSQPSARIERAVDSDDGNTSYVAIGPGGVDIVNTTNPPVPTPIGNWPAPPGADCVDLVRDGTKLYVACTDRLVILDVTSPASPALISTIILPNVKSCAKLGDALYIGSDSDVLIYDVTNPASPAFVGPLGSGATAQVVRVYVDGQRVYCLYANGRIYIASAGPGGGGGGGGGTPFAPVFLNALPGWPNASDLVVRGGYAYCAYRGRGLVIYDFRNALSPQQVWWDGGSDTLRVDVRGTTLACIYGNRRFTIASVANPRAPIVLSTNLAGTVPTGVSVLRNGFAFCGYGTSTILYDVPPSVVGTSPHGNSVGACPSSAFDVFFSTDLNAATVNGSSVQVQNDGTFTPVPATVSMPGARRARITPSAPLAAGVYRFFVSSAVENTRGTNLAPFAGFSSGFTIGPVCISTNAAPATVEEGQPASFTHTVAGPAGTSIASTGVRISATADPTQFFATTSPLGSGAPATFNSSWTALPVLEPTVYYGIPFAVAGGVTYYGSASPFTVTPRPDAPPVPGDLFAHWKFDEGQGGQLVDSGPNGFHGTHSGMLYVPGHNGNGFAMQFGGRALVEGRAGFQWGENNTEYTIAYWIRAPNPTGSWRTLMHKTIGGDCCSAGQRNPAHFLNPSNNTWNPAHGTVNDGNDYVPITIPLNVWVHVAEVHLGAPANTKTYYVNGAPVLTRNVGATVGNIGGFMIGWDGFYQNYNGLMDDLRVYRRALSTQEVVQVMNAP